MLKSKADVVINTNTTNQTQLKNLITSALDISESENQMQVTFVSFGF